MFTTTMGIGEHTLIQYPTYSKNIDDEYLNQLEYLILNNNDDFEIAKKVIGTHIKEYILPFFEKVPNLQTINDDIINKLTHDEYSDYIKGKSNFKALIIMKLCNNSNYDDFKNTLNHLYNHAIEVDKLKYEVDYNSFQKLLTYLEDEEYKKT